MTERTTRRAAAPHHQPQDRPHGRPHRGARRRRRPQHPHRPRRPRRRQPLRARPGPTESSIEALRGPYAVSQTSVSRLSATGFGGGTIYYPTTTADGTFGAIAISPGYTALESSISWLGPRLASQGFVVFTIDTLTTLDQPGSRGDQLLAALDYLTQRSSVRSRIDTSRLGVMGHSMGGGGSSRPPRPGRPSRPPSR